VIQNESRNIERVRHCVIYLSNHWSLELLMQDFYQLIHEDYLTYSLGGLYALNLKTTSLVVRVCPHSSMCADM